MVDIGGRQQTPLILALGEDGFLFFVELVLDVSDDLFEHVFHGDQARDAAMFVDHDGDVVARGAELPQQHIQALGLRNEDRRPDQGAQFDGGILHVAQQILGQKNAQDVVAIIFVDGKA